MRNADHAAPGFLNRERRGRSQHFQEDAFQYPAAFGLGKPGKIKLRPDDPWRKNQGIRELRLSAPQAAQDLHAHDAARQSIVGHARMVQIAAENDGEIAEPRCLYSRIFNSPETRACGSRPRNRPESTGQKTLWDAESPIPAPSSGIAADNGREWRRHRDDRSRGAAGVLQTYCSGKARRKRYHPKRMGGAIINGAAILIFWLLPHPTKEESPTVVLAGTRHGDHAKRKHLAR